MISAKINNLHPVFWKHKCKRDYSSWGCLRRQVEEWAFEQDIERGVDVCQMEKSRGVEPGQRPRGMATLAFSKAGIEEAE